MQQGIFITERQEEVLELVLKGASSKEIARNLGITVQTVKNHIAELLKVFGCETRYKLIVKCLTGSKKRVVWSK